MSEPRGGRSSEAPGTTDAASSDAASGVVPDGVPDDVADVPVVPDAAETPDAPVDDDAPVEDAPVEDAPHDRPTDHAPSTAAPTDHGGRHAVAPAASASVAGPPGPPGPPGNLPAARTEVVPAEPRLDASAHAHLLEAPLPPGSATETALIYAVTLAQPRGSATAPPVGHAPNGSVHDSSPSAPTPAPRPDADAASSAGDPTGAASPPGVARTGAAPRTARSTPGRKVAARIALGVAVSGLVVLTTYLWVSALEWRDQAGRYLSASRQLGDDLATTRNQLAGSQAELEAVRAQLSTAHERIVELADEKNQALDDWEFTQQLVDYQQRVSAAAGGVALALDRCVQGQQELIGYLQQQAEDPDAPPYDPEQLAQFETDVELLCQEASEANISLQLELAR